MFELIKSYFRDTLSILYPELCFACEELLLKGEKVICTTCVIHLPRTNFHRVQGNKMEKQFWGKAIVEDVSAFFIFRKKVKYNA